MPVLIKGLTMPGPRIRYNVIETISMLKAASAVPALVAAAKEPNEIPRVREHALRVAVRLDAAKTVDAIEVMAKDQNSSIRKAAAFEARWRFGGFSMLSAFADLMTDLRANALAAEFVRGKIREKVRDPATAALLSPHQPIGCKRMCVADDYYETFNRPNVHLVDVSEQPIEAITPGGLRTGGREHAFDTLVLATGFDAVTGTLMRMDLRGRGGLRIQDKWRGGPLNYLGMTVAGFPNLFNIAGAGSPAAFTSVILSIEHHVDWIAECIAWLDAQGHATIEATGEAESAWVAQVNAIAAHTVFLSCNSWYLGANIPGKPRMFMPLAGGFPAYAERCAAVAGRGYEGFALG